jgi:hypothetical protein
MSPQTILTITKLESLQTLLAGSAIAQRRIPKLPAWTDRRSANHPATLFDGIRQHLIRLGAKKSAQIFLLCDRLTDSELWTFHQLLKTIQLPNPTNRSTPASYDQLEVVR